MKKRYAIAIAVIVLLFLLAWAVFRGQVARELILKRNGLPLANLKADVCAGSNSLQTSTDRNGKLDLSAVPEWPQCILITLREGSDIVFSGFLSLPEHGSRTFDFRGKRTISTTKRTYADFGFFQIKQQEVLVFTDNAAPDVGPSKLSK
jgi:hypothetical protein